MQAKYRVRFKIRTILCLVTATAILAAYTGTVIRRANRHGEMVHSLSVVGGRVLYGYGINEYQPRESISDSWIDKALIGMFGEECYGTVKQIGILNPTPNSPLPATTIDQVRNFPWVTHLTLTDYTITADAIENIASLTQLRSVEFFRCVLNEEAISSLSSLDNLESLGLSNPSLNCNILKQVSSTMNIQDLRLYSFDLDSQCLKCLRLLTGLKSLTIWGLTMSDHDLKLLAENLSLESLVLENVDGISTKGLMELISLQTLESLAVVDCPGVQGDNDSIERLLPECKVFFSRGISDFVLPDP